MAWTSADPITPTARRWLVVATLVLFAVGTGASFRSFPRQTIAGQDWLLTLQCDFRREWCPAGWGWGSWRRDSTGLTGEAPADSFAVYFFGKPAARITRAEDGGTSDTGIGNSNRLSDYFRHGGDYAMETEVRLLHGAPGRHPEAQILIREGNAVRDESGLTLVAGRPSANVRYRAGGVDYVFDIWPLADTVEYGRWYRLTFIARDGQVRAEVDGAKVFDSRTDPLPKRLRAWFDSAGGQTGVLPPGRYLEPHVAVMSGVAQFRNVRLFVRPGDRWAFAR